jgi:hypothetical protein
MSVQRPPGQHKLLGVLYTAVVTRNKTGRQLQIVVMDSELA